MHLILLDKNTFVEIRLGSPKQIVAFGFPENNLMPYESHTQLRAFVKHFILDSGCAKARAMHLVMFEGQSYTV
jgi:hypothetical protein